MAVQPLSASTKANDRQAIDRVDSNLGVQHVAIREMCLVSMAGAILLTDEAIRRFRVIVQTRFGLIVLRQIGLIVAGRD